LSKLAKITPIFPNIDNQRSMIYIDNLTEFLKLIIQGNSRGIFCPQNAQYVNVSSLVEKISKIHNEKIYLTKLFNPLIKSFMNFNIFQRVFGTLVYVKELSVFEEHNYEVITFTESVLKSEILTE